MESIATYDRIKMPRDLLRSDLGRAGQSSELNQAIGAVMRRMAGGSVLAMATRQPKGADAARVAGRGFLDVIAGVPDRAVVAWINRGLRVILPAHCILCSLAFGQNSLCQRQLAGLVPRPTP